VRRQEETFNHIFDLTFAILPGDVVCDLLDQFTSVGCGHNYESLGRELFDRYSWGNKNVTAPDGFFVARDSVLAVELKFNAITSLDQLAKYLTLFVVEELFAGKREHLDLLYIFHSNPHASFTTQTGFAPDEINGNITDTLVDAGKGQFVRKILGDNREAMNDVLERIKIHCISWADFRNALVAFAGELENGQGDRTLRRLIDGLATAIAEHPLSNVEEPCDATRIRQPTKSSKTTADHTPKPTHLIR
jgi:hypothetical protein